MKLYAKTALLLGSVFLAFALAAVALLNLSETRTIEVEGLARAETLNRMAFEALYASMRQGAGREGNRAVIERLRQIEGLHEIHLIHGPPVDRQFGVEPDEQPQDDLDRQALTGVTVQEVQRHGDVRVVRYVTPVFVEAECQRCHRAEIGEVNGAISVHVSLAASDRALAARRNALLGGVAAGLLALGVVTFWGLRWLVVRPLQRVQAGMAALAAGNLSHRLDLAGGDEIAELARTFETMRASLSTYRQQVEFLLERLGRSGEDVDRWASRLAGLFAIATVLSRSLDLDELYRGFAAELRELVPLDRLSVAVLGEDGQHLRVSTVTGVGEATLPRGMVARVKESAADWVLTHRRPFICADLEGDESFPAHEALRQAGLRSYAMLPLLVRERLLGTLNLGSRQPRAYDEEDLPFLESAASQLAVAIDNARLYEKTQRQAITDPLTGLANRRRFEECVNEETGRARRYGHPLSMLMADIDHFKHYNDTHGHPAGDVVLQELAGLLRANVRETDFAARYGGEEFVVLLPETSREGALAVAEKIRAAVEHHPFPQRETQPEGRLTISLGVATFPEDPSAGSGQALDEPAALVRSADQALYQAKALGRNRVCAGRS